MAIFRSILKVPLSDGEHELHIVLEDRVPEVLVSLVRVNEGKSLRLRPTVRIPRRDAERIGKFLLGIREISDVITERVTREVTQPYPPGVGDLPRSRTDDGDGDGDGDG